MREQDLEFNPEYKYAKGKKKKKVVALTQDDGRPHLVYIDKIPPTEKGKKQYLKDGINYNNLEFNLSFSSRSNKETTALLKFLDDKAGFKIFRYSLPQPYNKEIDVYCPEWNHTYNFHNNNDIQVKFVQFRAKSSNLTYFDTHIDFVSI